MREERAPLRMLLLSTLVALRLIVHCKVARSCLLYISRCGHAPARSFLVWLFRHTKKKTQISIAIKLPE